MSLLNRFSKNIEQQNLFQRKDYLLLAVSGGADSVTLCELCFQAGFHFEIAHCNFQLRGEESERDERFVRELAEKYQMKLFVKKFDTNDYAKTNKVSIQVAARELRYQWFDELLQNKENVNQDPDLKFQNSAYLLTAHHADDNIETLLMNFFKGTGIKGLQGILSKQGKIIRPLLFARREEIISFIKENNLQFVEDSSNNSDKYTRNYFRHQLIPSIEKIFPQVSENLLNNLERFKEIDSLYHQSIDLHKEKLLERKGSEVHIPVIKLLKAKPLKTIMYEIIKEYDFTAHQTEEVVNLLKSETGRYISSASHKVIRNRNWLIIAPLNNLIASNILIDEADKQITFELGKLNFKSEAVTDMSPLKDFASENTAKLDATDISFPLLLRRWKQGDYFYPLGMQKKKKLSKFFIDQKLSSTEKEKTWIIESNKRIIWIIGKRIDNRFKLSGQTKNMLTIEFNKS